jgi:hypothetical protein
MASYPSVSAPYGYKPINLIGGQAFAGSTRMLPISYNYGTAIYYGDPVTLSATAGVTNGTIILPTLPVNTTNTIVGVFLGCYYTNPSTKQRVYSQYYPGSITAGDITAIVGDDPDLVFRTSVATATNAQTIGSASQLLLGKNMIGNSGATIIGSAVTGNSTNGVVTDTATAANAGFRVLQLVPDTQITTSCTYSSGSGTTSIVVTGLGASQAIPVGTDLFWLNGGQLQWSGSTVSTAVTASASGGATLTVQTAATVPSGVTTIALVQTPEVLVKINFNVHRYNIV